MTTPARSATDEAVDGEQLLLDLEARGDVLGELVAGHLRARGRRGRRAGRRPRRRRRGVRSRRPAGPVSENPRELSECDQVADRVHVLQRDRDVGGVGDVAAHPVDLVAPREALRRGLARGRGGDERSRGRAARGRAASRCSRWPPGRGPGGRRRHHSPRWRSMLWAKRRPMAATTPCMTVSTGIRDSRGSGRSHQISRSMATWVPGALGAQEVLALHAGALVGTLGVVREGDPGRLVEGHHLGEGGRHGRAHHRDVGEVPGPVLAVDVDALEVRRQLGQQHRVGEDVPHLVRGRAQRGLGLVAGAEAVHPASLGGGRTPPDGPPRQRGRRARRLACSGAHLRRPPDALRPHPQDGRGVGRAAAPRGLPRRPHGRAGSGTRGSSGSCATSPGWPTTGRSASSATRGRGWCRGTR